MTATLGSMEFDEVRGIVTPRTTPTVEGIDNPALVPAVVLLAGADRIDRLTFRGFHATSQVATIHALPGTVVTADDETGTAHTVLVRSVQPAERVARCGGTLGVWCEVVVEVTAWA
jgi:hypothetical protein